MIINISHDFSVQYINIYCSIKYFLASLKKLQTIKIITIPSGNAAIILTDCKLFIELSENTSATGKIISSIRY